MLLNYLRNIQIPIYQQISDLELKNTNSKKNDIGRSKRLQIIFRCIFNENKIISKTLEYFCPFYPIFLCCPFFKQFSSCCPILSDFSSLSILSNFVQLMLPQVVFEPESFHFLHSNSKLEVPSSNPSEGNHIFSCPKNSQFLTSILKRDTYLSIFWPFFRPLFNHFGPFLDQFQTTF